MLRTIRTFLQRRKTKSRLEKVLRLLYSEKIFQLDQLLNDLKPKDSIEAIDYYVIISTAIELDVPFTEIDIDKIYDEEIELLQSYVRSEELRNLTIDVAKTKANYALLRHNAFMRRLRESHERNSYSLGGLYYKYCILKGRPLSKVEEEGLKITSGDIEKLDFQIKEAKEKLDEHLKNT